jgi:hypothetical protein
MNSDEPNTSRKHNKILDQWIPKPFDTFCLWTIILHMSFWILYTMFPPNWINWLCSYMSIFCFVFYILINFRKVKKIITTTIVFLPIPSVLFYSYFFH